MHYSYERVNILNKADNLISKYTKIINNLAEQSAGQSSFIDLQSAITEFRCLFEEIKTDYSGCWETVEESLGFLEAAAQTAERAHTHPLILTSIQQLICDSELCLGAYFRGSKMTRDAKRCQYHVLPALITKWRF